MPFCPNCGKKVEKEDAFCFFCGCNLKVVPIVKPASITSPMYIEEVSVEETSKFFLIKNIPIEEENLRLLKINKKGRLTDINGKKRNFEIVKVVPLLQSEYLSGVKGKLYVLEKLKFESGEEYFRFGYYIVGNKGKTKDKWIWGQFCPIGPIKDFNKIIEKAKSEGF